MYDAHYHIRRRLGGKAADILSLVDVKKACSILAKFPKQEWAGAVLREMVLHLIAMLLSTTNHIGSELLSMHSYMIPSEASLRIHHYCMHTYFLCPAGHKMLNTDIALDGGRRGRSSLQDNARVKAG